MVDEFKSPKAGVSIQEDKELFGADNQNQAEPLPTQDAPFTFPNMESSYHHDTSQYEVVEWTPDSDGDYSIYVQSDGDSLVAIRDYPAGAVLAADDDILSGPNPSDGAIASVSLTCGGVYEVVVGQFIGADN